MTVQHTPGLWSTRRSNGDRVVYIQSGQCSRIADVHSFYRGFGPTRAERDANARLIVAAPVLLEALTELYHKTICGTDDERHAALAAAWAAISEATT